MILNLLARRSTVQRLHTTVHRNILRNHRFNSSSQPSTSNNVSKPSAATGTYMAYLAPLRLPFQTYSSMQKRRPLLTQWETTLIIYFLGDLSAQTVQSGGFTENRYEPIRGLRAVVIGAIISIPSYKAFLWLGRQFNWPGRKVGSLAAKIVFQQCVFTPIFNTYFFAMQVLLSGGGVREAVERVKTTVPRSWQNSLKVWPFVTAFLFTFVQPHNRSVCAGIVAIFWQTYLSWLNRKAEDALKEKEDEERRGRTTKMLMSGES